MTHDMKKWTTAILLFDVIVGLLFLGLWEQNGVAAVSGEAVTPSDKEAELTEGTVEEQAEDVRKIALTFDDEVIIGLSQEISYIRSRFYDLVLF